jgi:methylphosphotriester-DNA--protein-cysteine methyltransferase
MFGENSSARKTLGVQSDPGLTPEELTELVLHGGRGLVLNTGVTGRTRRRMLARDGISLHEVKRSARRTLAASLLSSSLPLKEIATKLGYSTTQTLSRFIRQEFGATPIELREKLHRE